MTILRHTLLLLLLPAALLAQTTSQTSFGKNRVQHNRQIDEWMLYETQNFVTYWYGDARNVAQAALQTAEWDYPEVRQMLEHQMSDKIEMLVFSDLTDLKQSNIGEDEVFQLKAGETKVIGNKVFLYFDGDHRHLRAQIRKGVAGVLINSMLFGANLQEIVQNAVLLNLPGWYVNGLAAYCGEEWNPALDDQLRNVILSGQYKTFDRLVREHPQLAGHAFWYYIGLHFGRGTISNLMYLTRINRSVDAGFLYVLGAGYRPTTANMLEYFNKLYAEEIKWTVMPDEKHQVTIRNKKKLPLYGLRLSPDGKRLAWVKNDIGKWRIQVLDLKSKEVRTIFRGGARNALQTTDFNYPQIAWMPDNKRMAILYESRDVPKLVLYDFETKKKVKNKLSPEFQRVFSMDFVNNNELVLSAAMKGYSDIFLYRLSNKQTERLTQDFWDDLDASVGVLDGKRGVFFSSNRSSDTLAPARLDTILPLNRFDVFFFDLENRSTELLRLTQTPLTDERAPHAIDSTHYTFLSDASGIVNRQQGEMEPYIAYHQVVFYMKDGAEIKALDPQKPSVWSQERLLRFLAPLDTVRKNIDTLQIDSIRFVPVWKKRPRTWNQTNYDHNLEDLHVSPRARKIAEAQQRDGKTCFFVQEYPEIGSYAPAKTTRYRESVLLRSGIRLRDPNPVKPPPPPPVKNNMTQPIIPDSVRNIEPGWLFQVPEHLTVPGPKRKADPARIVPDIMEPPSDTAPPRRAGKPLRPQAEFVKDNSILRFFPPQIIPYRTKFRTDYISTSMDNNLLFDGLQRYDGPDDPLQTPPPGVLLKANFKDLLENYVLEAGFRLPTTFNGTEYYVWFDDKKHLLDRRYALYRRTTVQGKPRPRPISPNLPNEYQERTNTLLGLYELRYPLDIFTSIRGTATLRQDRSIALSSDRNTLELPDFAEQRAGLRVSAIYDNTVDVDLNLRTGTRAKVWVEGLKRFEFNTQPKLSLRLGKGYTTIVGFDARHYQMLDRRSQIALRFAGAGSFGSEKMLYVLGGVENWIFPRFNENIPLPAAGESFAYQTLAANLRGFRQNIRNGSSYALFNAELRIPVFKYLSKKPTLSSFWRNFQVVGFADAGTAWQGISPYSGDNPINIVYLNSPTISVKVNYFRDPLVAAYGVGVRALIFGMYLRADYGWGIETRIIQDPVLQVSLGTDF